MERQDEKFRCSICGRIFQEDNRVQGLRDAVCIGCALYEWIKYRALGTLSDLAALVRAESEGRLVELPCKTVFLPVWDAGEDCDLSCPDSLGGESRCDTCKMAKLNIYERLCTQEDIGQIGKTVFLTREAAEAALAEKKGR